MKSVAARRGRTRRRTEGTEATLTAARWRPGDTERTDAEVLRFRGNVYKQEINPPDGFRRHVEKTSSVEETRTTF